MKNFIIYDITSEDIANQVLAKLEKELPELRWWWSGKKPTQHQVYYSNICYFIERNELSYDSYDFVKEKYSHYSFITASDFLKDKNLKALKALKSVPPKFIITWDEDTDPHKYFSTRKEAIAFLETLKSKNARNIKFCEIRSICEVEFEKVVKLKEIK